MPASLKLPYRRKLPHIEPGNRAVFVTFSTVRRWELPESVRGLVLRHCVHDHGTRLHLHGAVVMPDHVHLILTPLNDATGEPFSLTELVGSIKSVSSHSINRALKRTGPVWQREWFDRIIRKDDQVREKVEYICQNAVRAGLTADEGAYPWLWREWVDG